jgi:hypothetical protein
MERRQLVPAKAKTCSKCKGLGFYVDKRNRPRPPDVVAKIKTTKAARREREALGKQQGNDVNR